MPSFFKDLREFLWLYRQGFRPTEYLRNSDRISLHACGWRANGSGRMKTARDAVAYLEGSMPEQWRQVYCGLTPFLVSDRGNVRLIDGSEPRMMLANGRYQIAYKPEEQHPSRRGRRGGMAHKKRVYRSVLVAMAFLDFKKGDAEHEVHHVNGYRTDDRLVNLMVLTHDEHTRIHNMGPCGLTAPLDDAVRDAGLLAEVKPMGTMKLRRVKKKALKRALETPKAAKNAITDDNANSSEALDAPEISGGESQKPNRAEIIPVEAPAGTFTCNPLPVLDETGVFATPEAPEILAIKRAEEAQREAEKRAAEEKAAAEAAELAAIPARGNHKAEEKSSLQMAAEEGMAEVAEKIDAACVRSGARAQETINGEGPTKAAKRRASKKRAEARRAEEKAARREAQKQIAREESQVESDILDEASTEAECANECPQDVPIATASEISVEEGAAAESEAAVDGLVAVTEGEAVIEEVDIAAESESDIDEAAAEAKGNAGIDEVVAVAEGKTDIDEASIVEALAEAEVSEQNEPSCQNMSPCQNTPSDQGVSSELCASSSKQSPSPGQSDQKPAKCSKHLADSKRDATEIDWVATREALARETKAYLKAARKLSRKDDASSKQFASAAKPVYKAFKPFLTCPDEVCAFDACLVCVRLIAQDAQTRAKHGQPELPQTTHSLLGNFQKLMRTSVRKLIRDDEIVAACTEELLREEAAKPVYKSLPNSPLKQSLDIINSKKPKEAIELAEAPQAKPEENTATEGTASEGKASEGKRRRRRRRKKEPAENKGSEKQNRNAEAEEDAKAKATQ